MIDKDNTMQPGSHIAGRIVWGFKVRGSKALSDASDERVFIAGSFAAFLDTAR